MPSGPHPPSLPTKPLALWGWPVLRRVSCQVWCSDEEWWEKKMGGSGGGLMGMKALERKEVLRSGRGNVYGPCTHVRLIYIMCGPCTPVRLLRLMRPLVQNQGFRMLRLIDMEPNVLFTPSLRRSWTPKSAWRRSRQPSYSESTFDLHVIIFLSE
jgi:hypothetical protein